MSTSPRRAALAPPSSAGDLSRGETVARLLGLFVVAFAIRFLVVLCVYRDLPASVDHNEFGWEQGWIARSIALGRGFTSPFQPLDGQPTALVAPLYPYLLAGIFKLCGLYTAAAALVASALNAFISSSVVVPVFLLARKAAGSATFPYHNTRPWLRRSPSLVMQAFWIRRVPWIAATLWALYPFAIYYSGTYLWDHTVTSALFAWTFLFALNLRRYGVLGWSLWGLLNGITALSNPCILSLFPALVLVQVIGRGMQVRAGLLRVAAAGGVLALTLLPWTVRNVRVLHASVPIRDGYWGEFYAGNNDDTSHSNPGWTHPASNPAELKRYEQLGEIRYMAEKQELAMAHISTHPGAFAYACARRVVRFWTGFWSFSSSYLADEALDVPNVPFCTLLTIMTFLGMSTLLAQHRRVALCFLAALLIFPLPYYLTHASMDYRQPIEPEIVVLIAFGAAELGRRWQARRAAKVQSSQAVLAAS